MEKIYDVLVVGELNIDLILDGIQSLPEIGKEKLAQKMSLTLGSSSAIFASNISSLGASVAFIGKIGKDKFGEFILEELLEKGLDISMIKSEDNLRTGVTVVLNVEEDRANTTYPGAMNHLTIDDIPKEALEQYKHLHFSSYFLQPGMRQHLGELFKKAKQYQMTTSFDMQWDPEERWDLDIPAILPYVDIFLPNEQELLFLTRKDNLEAAILFVKKYVSVLVVKRGNQGSYVCFDDKIIDLPPFLNKNVVDAIGAGDSFNAGFIYKFLRGEEITECQRFGNLAGAISTMAAGGTTAFRDYENFKRSALQFGVII